MDFVLQISNFNIMSIYKDLILDHYKNSPYRGILKDHTIKKVSINPSCGDKVTFYLKIKKGFIENLSFQSTGCVISQASASILANKIKNKKTSTINNINENKYLKEFKLSKYSTRAKCVLLPLTTLKKIVNEINDLL